MQGTHDQLGRQANRLGGLALRDESAIWTLMQLPSGRAQTAIA
jgi:hypothetical protein